MVKSRVYFDILMTFQVSVVILVCSIFILLGYVWVCWFCQQSVPVHAVWCFCGWLKNFTVSVCLPVRYWTCEVWGSHSSVAEDSSLLSCSAVSLGEWFLLFWRIVILQQLLRPLGSWRWRYYASLKFQEPLIQWYSVTSLKASILSWRT